MRALIVEDEALIREGLLTLVDWAAEGFGDAIGCENAVDALEILTDKGADLVITDIYLDAISGLDMIEMARQLDVHTNFVILTGHGLFEYAQRAVELGVKRFLTKPIQPGDLQALLGDMRAEIAEQKRVEQALAASEAQLSEYYPLMRRDFWSNLAHENSLPEEEIRLQARRCNIVLPEGELQCVALAFSTPDMKQQTRLSIRRVLEELMGSKLLQWLDHGAYDLLIVSGGLAEAEIMSLVEVLRANFSLSPHAGLGNCVKHLSEMQTSAHEAEEAMQSIAGTGSAWSYFSDLMQVKHAAYPAKEEEAVLNAIRFRDTPDVAALSTFLRAVFHTEEASQRDLMLLRFQVALYRAADDYGAAGLPTFVMPPTYETMVAAHERLLSLIDSIANRKAGTRQQAINSLIEEAKHIVREKYADPDLNVSEIARQLFISPQYLSRLFHGVCDMTCMDFITSVRLDAAKKLLLGTQVKTYEVALMVGYNHPNYFSALFKKHEQKTPTQFRAEYEP
ncbi:MAG: helix-turn-helix domain-containing protein [Eubacteriales bacterium]|nr:helix-turn-helix domain-containing protein [Eubacteriales bacterium]